jgi:heme-binding protein
MKVVRVGKWILVAGAALLLLSQVVRPARTNPPIDRSHSIENQMTIDLPVASTLRRSCFDCHSNETVWPWYSNVAPVSWFVINHVNEGRRHLNFSEWGSYNENKKREKLNDICAQVKGHEMPLSSYTPLHPASRLTDEDVAALCTWASAQHNAIK